MSLPGRIAHAETLIQHALIQYSCDRLVLSFNGGKDCTVLLHLLLRVLSRQVHSLRPHSIAVVYVEDCDPFPEVEAFIDKVMERHSVFRLYRYRSSLKDAFISFKTESGMNDFAVLVGVRRTDPFCEHLREIQVTDNGWPRFLRIHPILDWDYADIWTYLDVHQHQYCSLYSQGYTSIGGRQQTVPNPKLRLADGAYLHARCLQSVCDERAGRLPRPN